MLLVGPESAFRDPVVTELSKIVCQRRWNRKLIGERGDRRRRGTRVLSERAAELPLRCSHSCCFLLVCLGKAMCSKLTLTSGALGLPSPSCMCTRWVAIQVKLIRACNEAGAARFCERTGCRTVGCASHGAVLYRYVLQLLSCWSAFRSVPCCAWSLSRVFCRPQGCVSSPCDGHRAGTGADPRAAGERADTAHPGRTSSPPPLASPALTTGTPTFLIKWGVPAVIDLLKC